MVNIKTEKEIDLMRKSGTLAANTLVHVEKFIKPGISTAELDQICHDYILSHNAIPACLNYKGFPKSICTSINEVICHGIPSEDDVLEDGDIVNIDVTTILDGYHGDTNRTFFVGKVRPEIVKLVETTQKCLEVGMEVVREGAFLGDIGAEIEKYAREHGYTVVREYCGHGIGKEFHEEPQVLHYGRRGTGIELKAGMTFTIEPMINIGKRHSRVLKDGWTVITKDKKPSAQFEHTIVVTQDGFEILTLPSI